MDDKVSIIVPMYNSEKYISRCLESLVNQTYENIEIILIDDGSIDKTYTICEKWVDKDNRIKLFKHENHGVSYTRNKGIKYSKGKYLSFIDADDIIDDDFIEYLLVLMENYKSDLSVIGLKHFNYEDKIEKNVHNSIKVYKDKNMISGLFNDFGGYMANKLYKKEIIVNNQLSIDENILLSEDLLFNVSYVNYCSNIVYDSISKYYYRQHNQSAFNNLNNKRWFDVLNVFEILIEKFKNNEELLNEINYHYLLILYESKYRIKKLNDKNMENRIHKSLMNFKNIKLNLNLKQTIKIVIFKYFPNIVMLYKRRMLEE